MSALKNLLQGRPFKTPLHPAVVHLPLALFPLSFCFDLASLIYPHPEYKWVEGAFVALCAGLVTAVLAAVFGMVDYVDIRRDDPAKKIATYHLVLNLVAVAIYALGAGLRSSDLSASSTPLVPLLLSIAALILLGISGYLGGKLVYEHGVGVGRHHRSTPLPEVTIKVTAAPGSFASIANESDLAEGETLRVDLNGTIVAVVRLEGNIFAFQEFCTHRYGPLSEGSFKDCQVTCPWHGSRFDVRTGRVTSGPAKVDLKTFLTRIQDGKIWIGLPAGAPGSTAKRDSSK